MVAKNKNKGDSEVLIDLTFNTKAADLQPGQDQGDAEEGMPKQDNPGLLITQIPE